MENFDISTLLARLETESIEFSVSEKSRFDASLDHMRYSFMPSVVVYAKSQADIQKLLKNCNELNIPVSVRGAGTGCAGGCVPICNEIVLDVSPVLPYNRGMPCMMARGIKVTRKFSIVMPPCCSWRTGSCR